MADLGGQGTSASAHNVPTLGESIRPALQQRKADIAAGELTGHAGGQGVPHREQGPAPVPRQLLDADQVDKTTETPLSSDLMGPPPATLPNTHGLSQQDLATPSSTRAFNERQLPSREVTDETLDEAYVAFILYCNPVVSPLVDTTELRRGFRSPPKSDGKTFNTYALLELIRKLETKEIKTWTQLAIQLGVEPPNVEKNQSTQKVQQYAVRLKVR